MSRMLASTTRLCEQTLALLPSTGKHLDRKKNWTSKKRTGSSEQLLSPIEKI